MRRNLVPSLLILLVASLQVASAGPLDGARPGPVTVRASLGECDVHVYPEGPAVAINCDPRGPSGQNSGDESAPNDGACFSLRLGAALALAAGCGEDAQAREAALLP